MYLKEFWAELIGTALLITLGCGSVANVLLSKSKGFQSGWLVICLAWGLAVMIAIFAVGNISGAHLNPAITIALVFLHKITFEKALVYITAQFLGAFLGSIVVWLHYFPHWKSTEDQDAKLAVFCTSPAIRSYFFNFISEFIASFVLMFGLLAIAANSFSEGLKPLIIGLLVTTIGLTLGGTTGWAINPARDFGPRLAHFLLPIPNKRDSDWSYAWIPIVAPILGCVIGGLAWEWMKLQF